MAYYLGLDNGGTVTKAAIFDSTGRSLATFKRDFAKVSDLTPQKSAALTSSSVVRLMTNSPVSSMNPYEYLSGLTEIYTIGGSVHIFPVHATVNIFVLPSFAPVLTSAGGTG